MSGWKSYLQEVKMSLRCWKTGRMRRKPTHMQGWVAKSFWSQSLTAWWSPLLKRSPGELCNQIWLVHCFAKLMLLLGGHTQDSPGEGRISRGISMNEAFESWFLSWDACQYSELIMNKASWYSLSRGSLTGGLPPCSGKVTVQIRVEGKFRCRVLGLQHLQSNWICAVYITMRGSSLRAVLDFIFPSSDNERRMFGFEAPLMASGMVFHM